MGRQLLHLVVTPLMCAALLVAAMGCRTLDSARRQQGSGRTTTFEASSHAVFTAALHAADALRLTILGQDEPEGYVWAQRRPKPLHSWEWLLPTPHVLKHGLQQAVAPGRYVALYLYPVDREHVRVEIVEERISPVGLDRPLAPQLFAVMQHWLTPPPAPAAP